jgi:hypothetical protein
MASAETADGFPPARTLFRRPIVGGREVLTRRLARELERNVGGDDDVRICIRGDLGHAIVCLDDRLLVLKAGFHAGTTFGAMAATIYYRDVTGIQIRTQLLSGWIEISSPSFPGRERRRFFQPRTGDRDVYKVPNCIPIYKRHVEAYATALVRLRRLVAAAKSEQPATPTVNDLERLVALREQGWLDDGEFAAAKAKLLG